MFVPFGPSYAGSESSLQHHFSATIEGRTPSSWGSRGWKGSQRWSQRSIPAIPKRFQRDQDTGATFWNELEEETELYDGREQDLMGVPWCEGLRKVNNCGVNMKMVGFTFYKAYILHSTKLTYCFCICLLCLCIYIFYIYIYYITV